MSKSTSSIKRNNLNKDTIRLRIKIDTMIKNGRKEIIVQDPLADSSSNDKRKILELAKKQLESYPIGSLISYMNTQGIFRLGGYIKRFDNEWFVYTTTEFDKNIKVRYQYVQKMWVGNVYKCKNDVVSIVPATNKKTKFSAKIGNVVVCYARDNYVLQSYTYTHKYELMTKWYEKFGAN